MYEKKGLIIKQNSFTEFLLYTTPNGQVKIEILLRNENIWLTQAKIAELFGVNRPAITKHLKNIFETGELKQKSVSSILEHTAKDGKKYKTLFYNLDAILSVGYRVNSRQATQFRIWATERLKEHTIFDHIEKLVLTGKINRADLPRLLTPSLTRSLNIIHNAFNKLNTGRLSPVFEKFNGAFSYDELRIARIMLKEK